MANLNQDYEITSLDVVTQIAGLGEQMGIEIVVKAPTGKTITVNQGATIELTWTDTLGERKLAKVLSPGSIDNAAGLSLGIYYPDGIIFKTQASVDAFFTGAITAKIYNATLD